MISANGRRVSAGTNNLPHLPPGPAFGRREDRLRPVPMADIDPGVRREDNKGQHRVNFLDEFEH